VRTVEVRREAGNSLHICRCGRRLIGLIAEGLQISDQASQPPSNRRRILLFEPTHPLAKNTPPDPILIPLTKPERRFPSLPLPYFTLFSFSLERIEAIIAASPMMLATTMCGAIPRNKVTS
jgi:hypothetical protein